MKLHLIEPEGQEGLVLSLLMPDGHLQILAGDGDNILADVTVDGVTRGGPELILPEGVELEEVLTGDGTLEVCRHDGEIVAVNVAYQQDPQLGIFGD